MPRVGGKRKKSRTHKIVNEYEYDEVPKSFVMKRSELNKDMKIFEQNLREMFYPFTAMKLKETKKLKMKNILFATKNFGANNLIFLSSKKSGNYVRLMKVPKGPSYMFKIKSFCLNQDLQRLIPRNKRINSQQLGVPMVVTKGFENISENKIGSENLKMIQRYFKGLFPSTSYFKQKNTKTFDRCVLFYFNKETNLFEIRNYYIKQTFTSINPNIKKMLNSNKIPDFSNFNDVGELFAEKKVILSDSDIDHLPDSKVEIEDHILGKEQKYKVNVRLYEIGPRVTMNLFKIEEGFMKGEILYHSLIVKTEQEKEDLRTKIREKEEKKAELRRIQDENVLRKLKEKEKKDLLKKEKREEKKKRYEEKQESLKKLNTGEIIEEGKNEENNEEVINNKKESDENQE